MSLSGLLRFCRDERVLLFGIGATTFTIVYLMTEALIWVRDDNEVRAAPPKTQYITQETEDSLQHDTVDKLLNHSNYSIRDIATKILCDRAVNDRETVTYLLYNITRPDYDTRMQSLRALATLTGQTHDGLSKLHNWKAYTALVRSLELSMGDVEHLKLDDKHWDEYYLRDMAERFCLMFILELVNKYDAEMLVKAKFIEKWLAKQRWGDTEEERSNNFAYYIAHKRNRIVDIVSRISHTDDGYKALIDCGLKSQLGLTYTAEADGSFSVTLQSASRVELDDNLPGEQVPRSREHSAEEQRLRRQHREAMVFNDGTRPIGRDDIIERSDNASP